MEDLKKWPGISNISAKLDIMKIVKQKLSPQDVFIEITSLYIEVPQTTFCLIFLHGKDLKKSPRRSKNFRKI